MTEKSEIDLLYEAAAFCGFKPADGWPAELNPRQLAALMAGGFKEPHKQAWRVSLRMIADAIKAGSLATRIEQPPDKYVDRWTQHPRADSWATGWGGIADGAWDNPRHRGMIQTTDKVTPSPIHHISPAACRDWLRAIRKAPSEYVLAWLGDAWQKKAPKVGAGGTASDWKATARAIGEKWMLAQEKETGKRPTIKQIAEHVADELSSQDIRGPRGKYPDPETIKREALKGITGRKKGDNLRR